MSLIVADRPGRSVSRSTRALVAASILDDGLHARVRMSSGEELWIEPSGSGMAGEQNLQITIVKAAVDLKVGDAVDFVYRNLNYPDEGISAFDK